MLTLTLTLNPSVEKYCMTLVLKMEKKLCSGQGLFKHLTFNCALDLEHIKTNFSHDTSTFLGEQVCKVFLKSIDKYRSYAPDKGNLNI